jgi:hypothetical protein
MNRHTGRMMAIAVFVLYCIVAVAILLITGVSH